MKKFMVGLLALVAVTTAIAQNNRVSCGTNEEVSKFLSQRYGEKIIFISKSEKNKNVYITIWFNEKTKTSTIVASTLEDNQSCLVEGMTDAFFVPNT